MEDSSIKLIDICIDATDTNNQTNFNSSFSSTPTARPQNNNNNTRRQGRVAQSEKLHRRSHARETVSIEPSSAPLRQISAANIKPKINGNVKAVRANADSGTTGNYLAVADISVLRDVCISSPTEQISVAVANGTLLQSTHHGYLDVPGHGAMIAYIFPQLKGSLLSISQLVNVGLRVTYCADFVTGFDADNNIVFQGNRDTRTGL